MFTDHFFPELGGIQDSVMLTARSLERRGHLVEIFAPHHPAADFARSGHPHAEPDLGSGVTIHRRISVPFASSTQQSRAAIPMPSALWALAGRGKPDVIHSHSFFGLGVEALVAGRLLGVPVVGTNHTNVPAFGPYLPVPLESAIDWVVGYYNRCEAITAPSRSVFDGLGRARMRLTPEIVSNPIDTDTFHPSACGDRETLKASFGLGQQVVAYAGRLGAEKNIDILLHALALLAPGTQLAIAGHGNHEPALRKLAAELGIAERVIFLGTLSQPRLAELFGAVELFAIMSTTETQSMVSLQAMASGLPVIAANFGALTEFIRPDCGRLTPPTDAAAIACAMRHLLGDDVARNRMGLAARATAQRFSTESVADSWEALYQRVQPKRDVAWSST